MASHPPLTNLNNRYDDYSIFFNNYLLHPMSGESIYIHQSGYKNHTPGGYQTKPAVYDHYIFHYIIYGHGQYYVDGKTVEIKPNSIFMIEPYKEVTYKASYDHPWSYYWVGFNGVDAINLIKMSGFSSDQLMQVYVNHSEIESVMSQIANIRDVSPFDQLKLKGYLYMLFSELIKQNSGQINKDTYQDYYQKAITYIRKNYMDNTLTIAEVAESIGINRSHLYKSFYRVYAKSPQEFLISYRLKNAVDMLKLTSYTINKISHDCGFSSQAYFSRIFKDSYGVSPSKYRKQLMNTR